MNIIVESSVKKCKNKSEKNANFEQKIYVKQSFVLKNREKVHEKSSF